MDDVVFLLPKSKRVTSALQPAAEMVNAITEMRAIGPSTPVARVRLRLLLNIDTPLTPTSH